MEITRKAEYAISALVDLALQEKGKYVLSREIAERQNIPTNFIPQIMAILSRSGLVEGIRGSRGGVRLRVDPAKITVAQVVELIEGPIAINKCLLPEGGCRNIDTCPLHSVWVKAQDQLMEVLEQTTIADVVQTKMEIDAKQKPTKGE
ncbi:MAG: RrF2 family transcriptional regulator [Limnochordia bacterium]|jgi:Rrf2 family protein